MKSIKKWIKFLGKKFDIIDFQCLCSIEIKFVIITTACKPQQERAFLVNTIVTNPPIFVLTPKL